MDSRARASAVGTLVDDGFLLDVATSVAEALEGVREVDALVLGEISGSKGASAVVASVIVEDDSGGSNAREEEELRGFSNVRMKSGPRMLTALANILMVSVVA